ncbi:precorrin-6A synthase (deacetylating) [Roseobacter sp. YSTF-M11]|uniref:Precorrin-6A synthase [deacetylating] n=1 Tax=Roseobacter insulae TaxID=2859783 RepID=A0A9X1JZ88_9RHOB|nr:precorrin-6A synthase (deacetylating) [Roseobacter insulae]MBW4709111.1 precorrin-6A synthase (deacetylating) [Roseobacter insulae]
MIQTLWLIGIGTGAPSHVTGEGMAALRDAAIILVPHKGDGKDDLAELRHRIIRASGSDARILPFDYPERDPGVPYLERVEKWHDEIARRWQKTVGTIHPDGPVALLVWGDPSLYDSTIRIAQRLEPQPDIRIVPGITAIQALTAAHAIPLNAVNGPVHITTGRRLRDSGWPDGVQRVVVMLDGDASFQTLPAANLTIWWGAYLGMPEQVLDHGPVAAIRDRIIATRAAARQRHGWIMDTYLLSKET